MVLLLRLFCHFLGCIHSFNLDAAHKMLSICKDKFKNGRKTGREEEVYRVKICLHVFSASFSVMVQINQH